MQQTYINEIHRFTQERINDSQGCRIPSPTCFRLGRPPCSDQKSRSSLNPRLIDRETLFFLSPDKREGELRKYIFGLDHTSLESWYSLTHYVLYCKNIYLHQFQVKVWFSPYCCINSNSPTLELGPSFLQLLVVVHASHR